VSDVPLEIERKLLVDAPDMTVLAAAASSVSDIVQTYLVPDGWDAERVRRRVVRDAHGETLQLTHTCKRGVSAGVVEELEEAVDEQRYAELLTRADAARVPIVKTRWVLPWAGRVLEVDHFTSPRRLWLLEVELDDPADLTRALDLPPWLGVLSEVTGDPRYSNVALAVPADEADEADEAASGHDRR
jgi:CYTH domain-containing protein